MIRMRLVSSANRCQRPVMRTSCSACVPVPPVPPVTPCSGSSPSTHSSPGRLASVMSHPKSQIYRQPNPALNASTSMMAMPSINMQENSAPNRSRRCRHNSGMRKASNAIGHMANNPATTGSANPQCGNGVGLIATNGNVDCSRGGSSR